MTTLAPSLLQLESARLIRLLAEPDRAYFFRHILIQESAYDTLLKQERKALHRAIALTLEQQGHASAAELARHFMAAEMPDRAAHYFTRAAKRAQARFENNEAITFFRAALDQESRLAEPSSQTHIELYEGLSDINRYVMDDETRELVVAMREAAQESGDAQQILNARFSMAFVDLRRRDLEASEREFLWSIDYARELGSVMYLLWSMTYLAVLHRWRGKVERVRELVESAQKLEGAKNTPWHAAGLANLAWVALRENNAEQARQLAQAAIKMWEPFGEMYPFKTLALFPLLELARRERDSERAMQYISEIQKPSQEKLDDNLVKPLMRAQNAFAAGDSERAWNALDMARAIAQVQGFV